MVNIIKVPKLQAEQTEIHICLSSNSRYSYSEPHNQTKYNV